MNMGAIRANLREALAEKCLYFVTSVISKPLECKRIILSFTKVKGSSHQRHFLSPVAPCPRPIQDEMRRRGLTRGAARRADESEPFHPWPRGSGRSVSLHRDLAAHHAMMAGLVAGYSAAMDSGVVYGGIDYC